MPAGACGAPSPAISDAACAGAVPGGAPVELSRTAAVSGLVSCLDSSAAMVPAPSGWGSGGACSARNAGREDGAVVRRVLCLHGALARHRAVPAPPRKGTRGADRKQALQASSQGKQPQPQGRCCFVGRTMCSRGTGWRFNLEFLQNKRSAHPQGRLVLPWAARCAGAGHTNDAESTTQNLGFLQIQIKFQANLLPTPRGVWYSLGRAMRRGEPMKGMPSSASAAVQSMISPNSTNANAPPGLICRRRRGCFGACG